MVEGETLAWESVALKVLFFTLMTFHLVRPADKETTATER